VGLATRTTPRVVVGKHQTDPRDPRQLVEPIVRVANERTRSEVQRNTEPVIVIPTTTITITSANTREVIGVQDKYTSQNAIAKITNGIESAIQRANGMCYEPATTPVTGTPPTSHRTVSHGLASREHHPAVRIMRRISRRIGAVPERGRDVRVAEPRESNHT